MSEPEEPNEPLGASRRVWVLGIAIAATLGGLALLDNCSGQDFEPSPLDTVPLLPRP